MLCFKQRTGFATFLLEPQTHAWPFNTSIGKKNHSSKCGLLSPWLLPCCSIGQHPPSVPERLTLHCIERACEELTKSWWSIRNYKSLHILMLNYTYLQCWKLLIMNFRCTPHGCRWLCTWQGPCASCWELFDSTFLHGCVVSWGGSHLFSLLRLIPHRPPSFPVLTCTLTAPTSWCCRSR